MRLRADHRPLYVQAAERISELIQREELARGDRLPSESQIGERLGVSRNTIREALRELELRGEIKRIHGRGTIVTEPQPILTGLAILESLESLAARQGWVCGTQDIRVQTVALPSHAARFFELPGGDPGTYLSRLKTRDGHPVCLMESWMPSALFPAEELRKAFTYSIIELLRVREHPHLDYAVAEVGATGASQSLATSLDVHPGIPLLVLTERFYENPARPICYSENTFVPASIRLEVTRRPPPGPRE